MPRKPLYDTAKIGVLARAINAVENCWTKQNAEENERDASLLRDMLLAEADSEYSAWLGCYKSSTLLTAINKELEDAGWDNITFCVNRDEKDAQSLTWYTEE